MDVEEVDIINGFIAENYVLCELLRNNFRAYTNCNPREPGYDIIVLNKDNKNLKEIKLQVKALDWRNETNKTISGKFDGEFDILIIVILHFYKKYNYTTLIIPKSNIRQKMRDEKGILFHEDSNQLLYQNRTMTLTQYKNKSIRGEVNREF